MEFQRDESPGPFRRAVWIVEGQTLVGLHKFPDPSDTLPFDERRIGLDHLAFACRGRDELEAWEIRLSELGIDNGGIVDAGYGAALSCRDPDNIALEFFTPALRGGSRCQVEPVLTAPGCPGDAGRSHSACRAARGRGDDREPSGL